jgi:hypothetical protein
MDIEELLERYGDADDDRRLGMFLAHRELREAFTEVDRRPAGGPEKSRKAAMWERLHLLEAGGSVNLPESHRLPGGWKGLDIAALVIAALLAGGGLRLMLAADAATPTRSPGTQAAPLTRLPGGAQSLAEGRA